MLLNSKLLGKAEVRKAFTGADNDGTAITGTTIDRKGFDSAIFALLNEASSGTPTTATAAIVIEHGDASDLSDAATFVTLETALNVKAACILQENIDLSSAKRYIRVTIDITYSGGTSPKNVVAGCFVLGDAYSNPPVAITQVP